jgi:hypothetical protein
LTAAEEAGRAESAQQSRERRGLREFGMKSETTRGGLLFICSKISTSVLKLELLLIVLESGLKQF